MGTLLRPAVGIWISFRLTASGYTLQYWLSGLQNPTAQFSPHTLFCVASRVGTVHTVLCRDEWLVARGRLNVSSTRCVQKKSIFFLLLAQVTWSSAGARRPRLTNRWGRVAIGPEVLTACSYGPRRWLGGHLASSFAMC